MLVNEYMKRLLDELDTDSSDGDVPPQQSREDTQSLHGLSDSDRAQGSTPGRKLESWHVITACSGTGSPVLAMKVPMQALMHRNIVYLPLSP